MHVSLSTLMSASTNRKLARRQLTVGFGCDTLPDGSHHLLCDLQDGVGELARRVALLHEPSRVLIRHYRQLEGMRGL